MFWERRGHSRKSASGPRGRALVLVDGAQSVPHLATRVREMQIDFLAFSGHKLYGPTGIGVLYGRRALLEAIDPFLCGGHMIGEVFWDHSTWAGLPAKFEAGTIPIAQAIALGTAVDFVGGSAFRRSRLTIAISVLPFQRLVRFPA